MFESVHYETTGSEFQNHLRRMCNVGTWLRFGPNVAKRFGNRGGFVADMVNAPLIPACAGRAVAQAPMHRPAAFQESAREGAGRSCGVPPAALAAGTSQAHADDDARRIRL
ncbi:MAG: hypothetical protein KIT76_02970 [Pseudolabrys sp.]|jgi:hypothetical protein|nr:hypothetical protein [Pseudolabrys sp.]